MVKLRFAPHALFVILCSAALTSPAQEQPKPAVAPQAPPSAATQENLAAQIDRMLKETVGLRKKGKYDELASKAEEALRLSQSIGDKRRIALSLNYIGAAHEHRGRMEQALEVTGRAAEVAEESGDPLARAITLNSLGTILKDMDRFEEALAAFTRVLAICRERGDQSREAVVLRNIGMLHIDLHDYDKAEPILQDSLRLARASKQKEQEQSSLITLGRLEKGRGRFQAALQYYEQALAIGEVSNLRNKEALLSQMSNLYGQAGDLKKALEMNGQGLDLARASGAKRTEALLLGNRGAIQKEMGQFSEALDSLARGRALLLQVGNIPETRFNIEKNVARAQLALGKDEEALRSFREALAALERIRAGAVRNEASGAGVVDARGGVFVEMVDLLNKLGREAEALEVAERYRARAFLDLLAESRVNLRQELSGEQRHLEDQLFARISAVQKELWQKDVAPESEQRLKRALTVAENDLEAFRLELRRTQPRYTSVHYPEPLTPERIQRELLDADTALVEYMLGEKRSFAWVVTQNKLTVVALPPRQEITERVTAYRQALTERVSALTLAPALARFETQSRQLYRLLFQPLEVSLTSSRRLIIVPDGLLAYLPFETLSVSAEARAGSSRAGASAPPTHLLLERFAITYAPSASALAAIKARDRRGTPRPKRLVAFGDPTYDRGNNGVGERSAENPAPMLAALNVYAERGFDFQRLPYTRAEVSGIGSLFPAAERQVYLGAEAREQKVKAERLEKFSFIHFAAHGLVDEEKPLRSGIVLSLDADPREDGVLQMSEIMRLKMDADLVTLSACRTGLGKLLGGEGIIGLTRAFFYAGASSVAVSLWNVNDIATAELMKAFYQNLSRGVPKDEALRQAKLRLIRGEQRTWRHPYFWAPFVLVGERK